MNIKNKLVAVLALAAFVLPGMSLAQTTSGSSVASIQAQINALLAQLQVLQSQLTASGGTVSGTGTSGLNTGTTAGGSSTASNAWCYTFNTNLTYGSTGSDVTALQTALQQDGESVAVNGTFDDQTAAAVTSFQEKYANAVLSPYGLKNGTGYVGPSTRGELNTLFGCGRVGRICPVWGCNGPEPVPTPIVGAMRTYTNKQYGFSFSYPSNYTVTYGNSAASIITIKTPSNLYPDTDFGQAYFTVGVNTQANSAQCYSMNAQGRVQGTKTVDGVAFNWAGQGGAAAGTESFNAGASGYTNGVCYVAQYGYTEYGGGIGMTASDGTTIVAFNQGNLIAVLNGILSTIQFTAPQTPGLTSSLNVQEDPGATNFPVMPGTAANLIGSYIFTAPSTEGVNISTINVMVSPEVNTSYFQNLKLIVNGVQFGATQTVVQGNMVYAFTGSPVNIGAGTSASIHLFADVLSSVQSGTVDSPATEITGCAATGAISYTAYTCNEAIGQSVAFGNGNSGGSSLSVGVDSSNPASGVITQNTTGNVLAVYRVANLSTAEAVKISNLNIIDTVSMGSVPDFSNLQLWSGGTLLGTAAAPTGNASGFTFTFANFANPIVVPQGGTISLTLKGDAGSYSSGSMTDNSSASFTLDGSSVAAFGASSNAAISASGVAVGNPQTVTRTVLSIAGQSATTMPSAGFQQLGSMQLTANAAGDAVLNSLTLTFGGSAAGNTSFMNSVALHDQNGNNVVADGIAQASVSGNRVTWTFQPHSNPFVVTAGSGYSFSVWGDLSQLSTAAGVSQTVTATIQGGSDFSYYDGTNSSASLLNLSPLQVPPITVVNLAGAGTASQNPTITSISPNHGGVGSTITAYGTNLSGAFWVGFYDSDPNFAPGIVPSSANANSVTFTINSTFAANVVPGTYQIDVQTPPCATPGGCISNRLSFTLDGSASQNPVISSVTTELGNNTIFPGTTVEVNGSHFDAGSYISLDGVQSINPSYWNGSLIEFPMPSVGAGNHTIWVSEKASNVTSNHVAITVSTPTDTPIPQLTSISPSSATTGTVVNLYGANLQGATEVWFYSSPSQQVAGIPASSFVVSSNGTSLTFTIPTTFLGMAGAGNYQIRVQNSAGIGNSEPLTVVSSAVSQNPVITPTSLSFAATQGGANPAAQTLSFSPALPTGWQISWDCNTVINGSVNCGWMNMNGSASGGQFTGATLTPNTSGLSAGTYSGDLFIINSSFGTYATIPVTLVVSAPAAASYGTLSAGLDPSSPVAGTVTAGQTGVTFARVRFTATGGPVNLTYVGAGSNSANAISSLSNIRVYNGSTLLGSAGSLTAGGVTGAQANVFFNQTVSIPSGGSVVLTYVADVASSANGALDLGLSGSFGGNYATVANQSFIILGNNMTVSSASGIGSACPDVMPYCPYGGHTVLNSNGCTITVCNGAPVTVQPTVSQVQGLQASVSGISVTLSWSAATATNGIGLYNIYRSTTPNFTPSASNRIAQGNVLSYTDAGLSVGTYYYAVAAQDANGLVGTASSQVSATVNGTISPVPIINRPILAPVTRSLFQSSAADNANQTAIVSQSLQGVLNQLQNILKGL